MATISFKNPANGVDITSSGIGFYFSGGFGASVPVGSYQASTYITNSNGTVNGGTLTNCRFRHANSGQIGSVTLNLTHIPNIEATVQVRFTHDSAVLVQNILTKSTARDDEFVGPTGFTLQCAEIRHTGVAEIAGGLGSSSWTSLFGSGAASTLYLTNSPGSGGFATGVSTVHDWFLALSASPTTVGTKLASLRIGLEYY